MVAFTTETREQQQLIRSAVRQFVEAECTLSKRLELERTGDEGALWSRLAAAGWTGILVPEELGGVGASLADAGAMWEELGRGLVPGPHLATSVLAASVFAHPSAGERGDLLRRITEGTLTVAVAVTERDYAWDPHAIALTVRRDRDAYVLNGEKLFVPDVGTAGHVLCAGRWTDGGLALALLAVDTPGVQAQQLRGWNGTPLAALTFRDVRVAADDLIGPPGEGWSLLGPAVERATAVLCAYIAGACERVLEISFRYAHRRRQFGQAIARFQRVQDHLIIMRNWTDRARVTAGQALAALDSGDRDAPLTVSLAKATAAQAFVETCEAAHHLHAGIGSDKAYGLYLYTKAARTYYHYLGSPVDHERRIATHLRL